MNNQLVTSVLSIRSENDFGLVAQCADFLSENHANIISIAANKIGRLFSLSTRFSVDKARFEAIRNSLEQDLDGLSPVLVKDDHSPIHAPQNVYECTVFSEVDAKGIVYQVIKTLTNQKSDKVDILAIGGCSHPAPFTGASLFVVRVKLQIPSGNRSADKIRSKLDLIAEEHDWDINFSSLNESVRSNPPKRESGQHLRLLPEGRAS